MDIKWLNILKLIKTGLMVLAMVFCLAACTSNKGDISGAELSGEESELDEQQRACWQASLLKMFYNAMAESSMKAYPKVTKGALPFIMVAFAVWLSFRVLSHLSSLTEESPAEVWTEVSRMAVLCLFCGLLASSTSFLLFTLNKFIFPVYYAFLEFGSRILELAASGENADSKGQMFGDTCLIYTNSLVCAASDLDSVTFANGTGTFPSGPSDMMQCMACATSDRMQVGFVIAREMFAATSLSSWVSGTIIYVIFIFVKISFVFYLVDSIFRMNIIVIILPLLILAVPFKYTRKWAKNGLLTIFNSSGVMMCIAIIAAMAMLAMQQVINDNYEYLGDKQAYQEFGIVMLSMIMIAFLVLKSLGLAVSLANSIVGGGGNTNFQKKIGKLAAWTGKKAFSLITLGAGAVFTSVIDKVQALREAREKIKNTKRRASSALRRFAGRE